MERSIAARLTARSSARFVHPSAKARERRLGLRGAGSFQPASATLTVLRRPGDSVLAQLRGDWRAIRPAPSRTEAGGRPRPAVRMRWTGSPLTGATRPPSAAPAPWRA
jgi:hypothetical protein